MNWEREAAIYRNVWYLTEEERDELDTHVALKTTLTEFGSNVFEDTEDHCKDKITIGVVTYEVHYLNTSAKELEETYEKKEEKELLLSLRVINNRSFAVCLVQPKWDSLPREKYLSYRTAVYSS
jgi:hypothetical protein